MSDQSFDQELDCRGLNCPLPVLKTKKAMDSMTQGEVLKMISSDPGSMNDITAWANRTGNDLLSSGSTDDGYVFIIKKV